MQISKPNTSCSSENLGEKSAGYLQYKYLAETSFVKLAKDASRIILPQADVACGK
jgi:hypothetical protein